MKKILSLFLTFCIICSVIAIVPSIEVGAYASPVDINGNTKTSANFIIDPGHGGSDPGACLGSRHEADDVLRLSLAVGRHIIDSGYSVAFTRTTDFYNSPSDKAKCANSGSFSYFVSLHRNASGVGGVGYETYYYSGTSSKNLANNIHNKMTAIGCWRDRGVKTAAYTVLTNTTMPAVLCEVGFIDVASENVIFDTYFDQMALAIANGMLAMYGASVTNNKVSAPTVTTNSTVAYGAAHSVSWAAVKNATSYNYTAKLYAGEPGATSATTIVSSSTTGTSFTIPAQSSGKYIVVTVTAVGPSNTASTSKTIMMGPYYGSYPTDVEYIPVNEINGGVSTSNSTIWTAAKGSAFTAVYWRVFMCSPNSDGTYKVTNIYEQGASKSVTASGNNVVFAIHTSYANYNYAAEIVVGDNLTFCGIFFDTNTIRGTGYILVNGGKPLHPDSLSVKDNSPVSLDGDYLVGTSVGASAASVISMYNEDAEYIKILDMGGNTITTGVVGTGYTVNLIVDGETLVSHTIVIDGDVTSDGAITTADLLSLRASVAQRNVLKGCFEKAGDIDGTNTISTTDFAILRKLVANKG
ncbi:MAG: hypothetical protein E7597_05970 [Ruminococcaceae bacterium]|nr:hypothetical protein [Oscillospiraceae bacterium]